MKAERERAATEEEMESKKSGENGIIGSICIRRRCLFSRLVLNEVKSRRSFTHITDTGKVHDHIS